MSDLGATLGSRERPRASSVIPGLPIDFACPEDMVRHCAKIFAGEYDVPGLTFGTPPRVLDIGANVGAFSVWASQRWPDARVRCYEPNPEAFRYLQRNVETDAEGSLVCAGVLDLPKGTTARRALHLGRNNLGEASVHDIGEQTGDTVPCEFVPVDDLPDCDILKVDTEGCEVEIVRAYLARTGRPRVVLLEFHRHQDRRELDRELCGEGYTLTRARIDYSERGVLAYVRLKDLQVVAT